ncbi:hypothetical protein THARTR1_01413 [Trichoderma harzianum]|uniref:Apple domain-containing protein n=1 Tax=Trichoderma harzianum TaxID=5544 RepID=A0A2K0UN35_TRIHA|nr:hypothetical protein THARTR1_01413 [Trichoderma harzianum]
MLLRLHVDMSPGGQQESAMPLLTLDISDVRHVRLLKEPPSRPLQSRITQPSRKPRPSNPQQAPKHQPELSLSRTLYTTTAWATLTAVATTTAMESDFSTVTITTTSVETDTSSTTVTTTQDSTSMLSWAPETCTPGPPPTFTLAPTFKRSENHYNELPRDCSCFLTSTKSCGPRVTKVVTKTKEDRPKIITKTVTDRNCKTVTTTKTSTTHVNGAPPPKQTVTLTTTSTSTTTATSISTVEETTTATESTTTTVVAATTVTTGSIVTQTENPCDPANINKYILQGPPSNPNVVLGFRGDGFGDLPNCCGNCLRNNNCVFWKMTAGGSICENYYTNGNAPVEGCTSTACPRGHPVMNVSPDSDGNTYGMSRCGRFQIVF